MKANDGIDLDGRSQTFGRLISYRSSELTSESGADTCVLAISTTNGVVTNLFSLLFCASEYSSDVVCSAAQTQLPTELGVALCQIQACRYEFVSRDVDIAWGGSLILCRRANLSHFLYRCKDYSDTPYFYRVTVVL